MQKWNGAHCQTIEELEVISLLPRMDLTLRDPEGPCAKWDIGVTLLFIYLFMTQLFPCP